VQLRVGEMWVNREAEDLARNHFRHWQAFRGHWESSAVGRLEMHRGVLPAGAGVLVVDDVLATGGTVAAARDLLTVAGAVVTGAALVLELTALGGRGLLDPLAVRSLQVV